MDKPGKSLMKSKSVIHFNVKGLVFGGTIMRYVMNYKSPFGKILLVADEIGLIGVWFDMEKYYVLNSDKEHEYKDTPVFTETSRWLDIYFSGKDPEFLPPLHMIGSEFQKEIWNILLKISYGQTTTYGEIANEIAVARGIKKMAAQAVGGAVGSNDISIIVPCHRVIGKGGSLTGYGGGIEKKEYLLRLEGAYRDNFFIPKQSTKQ